MALVWKKRPRIVVALSEEVIKEEEHFFQIIVCVADHPKGWNTSVIGDKLPAHVIWAQLQHALAYNGHFSGENYYPLRICFSQGAETLSCQCEGGYSLPFLTWLTAEIWRFEELYQFRTVTTFISRLRGNAGLQSVYGEGGNS